MMKYRFNKFKLEKTITLPYKDYLELEKVQSTITKLQKDLEEEKKKKEGILFLRSSLMNWNPYEGSKIKVGIFNWSVENITTFQIDKAQLELAVSEIIRTTIYNGRNSYMLLTKEYVKKALDEIDKQREFLRKEQQIVNDKYSLLEKRLRELPKWLKWFIKL